MWWIYGAEMFTKQWNFYNKIVGIDGKHIAKQSPKDAYNKYYNSKKFYSTVM